MPAKQTAKQILEQVREIVSQSTCDEKELYEELMAEAEGWKMRLEELEEDDEG